MKNSEIQDIINDLEARFPVEQWRLGDIHIWPLIRINFSYKLFYATEEKRLGKNDTPRKVAYLSALMLNFFKYGLSYFRTGKNIDSPKKNIDVAFLSDGISYCEINGLYFDKFCDPFITEFNNNKISSFTMVPSFNLLTPTYYPTRFIQLYLEMKKIKNELFTSGSRSLAESLEGYDDCYKFVGSKKLPVQIPPLTRMKKDIGRIHALSTYYEKILALLNPALGLVVNYFGPEGMAFNLACRRLNIPSLDIQHGVQGELHFAYGRWFKVPDQGYEMLPTFFWVWTDYEAAAIRRWNGKVARWHQPLVGGNLWLRQWQKGQEAFMRDFDQKILALMEKDAGKKNALISLRGVADQEILLSLLEPMKSAGSRWRWWLRLHPCSTPAEREPLRAILHENRIACEFDTASALPLFALLRHMDVHLTHSSSTVLEAEAFGLPSIIFSEHGAELYPEQVSSGSAVVACTALEILNAMESLEGGNRGRRGPEENSKGVEKQALKFLTDIIQARRRNDQVARQA